MKISYPVIFLYSTALIFTACRTGHCRRDRSSGEGRVLEKVNPKPPTSYRQGNMGQIVIAKADGSLQCEPNSGLNLNQMAGELLAGIEILSSSKQNDGLVRVQVCGEETGILNTYKIYGKDIIKARKAGFTLFEIR